MEIKPLKIFFESINIQGIFNDLELSPWTNLSNTGKTENIGAIPAIGPASGNSLPPHVCNFHTDTGKTK